MGIYNSGLALHLRGMVRVFHELFPPGSGGRARPPQGEEWRRRIGVRGRAQTEPAMLTRAHERRLLKSWESLSGFTPATWGMGDILPGKLVPFIMELNLYLAQEAEKPNEGFTGGTGTGEEMLPQGE